MKGNDQLPKEWLEDKMNWVSFTIIWGLGNYIFGVVLNNLVLRVFGMGIIFGGLCIAIAHDKEKIKGRKKK